jgi:P27 family predicted phage terminase small subunit
MENERDIVAPSELGAAAQAEWQRVVSELRAKDMLTELDRSALAAYCGAFALWAEAMTAVQKFGSVVKTASGFPVQSPYVSIANKQAALMMRIAGEFGFTPATRDRQPPPGKFARYDLFGDLVPENWGERGRPAHIATQENRNRVSMLLAFGWSNERIAGAIGVTTPTLRKCYKAELKIREAARDRLEARTAMLLWEQFQGGNPSAGREFRKLLERNDLMRFGQQRPPSGHGKGDKPEKAIKLGKKDAARQAAHEPDPGTPLGELMAARQGQQIN